MIKKDFEKNTIKSWQEKEDDEINYIINKKIEKFTEQESNLKTIQEFINSNNEEKDILFIKGEKFNNNRTVINKIYDIYKEKYDIIPIFINNTENSKDVLNILKYQVFKIYKLLLKNLKDIKFAEKLSKILQDSNVLLEFTYNEETNKIINIKPIKYNKIITNNYFVDNKVKNNIEINNKPKNEIIIKETNQIITKKILKENISLNIDLYYKISNKKIIFLFDSVEKLEEPFEWLINKQKINVKYIVTSSKTLENAVQKLSRIENITLKNNDVENIKYENFNENILGLIVKSKRGLRQKDIEEIYKKNNVNFDETEFKQILNSLDKCFIIKEDGRVDFWYSSLKNKMCKRYKDKMFANTNQTFENVLIKFAIKSCVNNESIYLCDMLSLLKRGKYSHVILLGAIFDAIINKKEDNKRIIAREIWKYFKENPEWIYDIQDYYNKNLEKNDKSVKIGNYLFEANMEILKDIYTYFYFWFYIMYENIGDNKDEKNLFLDLLRWWNKKITQGDVRPEIKENLEDFKITVWGIIIEVSNNAKEIYSLLDEYCKIKKLNLVQIINVIKSVKIMDKELFTKRLEIINELLENELIKKEEFIYDELIKYKAETYYFMKDEKKYSDTILQNALKYKIKFDSEDGTFEDGKRYIETLKEAYTYLGNSVFKEDNKTQMVYLKDLINKAKEVLEWTELQYNSKKEEKSKLEFAKACELVARQYNTLIYKKNNKHEILKNNEILLPYDSTNGSKYIKMACEILNEEGRYRDYLLKIINYEIETLELEENKEKCYNRTIIQKNCNKAKETLKYEDVNRYIQSIPILVPIYEANKYDVNLEEIMQIYEEFDIFYKQYYNRNLYNEAEEYRLESGINKIKESKITIFIVKKGLNDNYIEEIIKLFQFEEEWIEKMFEYKNYQYYYEKKFEKRKKIINTLEQFTNDIKEFCRKSNSEIKYKMLNKLYNIRIKAYNIMAEDEALELLDNDEEKNELKNILNKLLLDEL